MRATASKGVMVAQDGVIIWVQVFTSRIWGVALEGHVVGALPWRVTLLGLGVLGIGIVSLLLGSLGGSPLLLVAELDGPATCGPPVTSQMLASQMGVRMFRGGE